MDRASASPFVFALPYTAKLEDLMHIQAELSMAQVEARIMAAIPNEVWQKIDAPLTRLRLSVRDTPEWRRAYEQMRELARGYEVRFMHDGKVSVTKKD